jgi:oligopeptide transport system substrate-binding protein
VDYLYQTALVLGALSQELQRRHHLVQAQGELRVDHQFLSRFRFTHTMFQQYLYNAFSPGERRLLHGAIATVLEDLFQEEGEEVTVQLARHYAEAGQVEQAVDYLLRAGDRARDLYAHEEAIGFYEQALTLLKGEGANERAARALMKLGLTHHLAFNFQRAREAYQEGFALWQRAVTDPTPPLPPAPHPLRMIWFDPTTLDPGLVQDDISVIILTQLFSGLVTLNAELDVVPELAQSWEVLEGGVRYIFHLRDDALWTDGQPVTAEDFVHAWKRALKPGGGSTAANFLYDIKGARTFHQGQVTEPDQIGVRALDTVTLLVELEGPTGFFPQLLTQPALFPVPRHVVEAHGEAWTEMEYLVTNGPFKLERWQPGHSMLLTRNPHYRGQFAGNVDEVDLILNAASVADQSELYAADRLDIVQLWASPDSDRVRQRHAEEYLHGPALSTHYVGFNVTHAPFNDLRVRRALALATDKETLASVNMWGYSFPATGGFVPAEMPGHSPGIGLAYDPELARELLAEAGYPAGQKFPRVQGLVHTPNRDLVCEPLRVQWRENLGIDVEWQTDDFGSMLDKLEKDPPDLFYGAWRADYPDPDNPLRVSSHSRWTGWQNEVYFRLLKEAKRTSNQPERIKQYQEADRILVEETAVVPLLYGRNHLLVKPWVRKFSTSAMSWFLWKDVVVEPHE